MLKQYMYWSKMNKRSQKQLKQQLRESLWGYMQLKKQLSQVLW